MECSQILTTTHPFFLKKVVLRRSLFLFFFILSLQKSSFSRCFQRGYCQPCQKSLSKKTQTFRLENTISGFPLIDLSLTENFNRVLLLSASIKSHSNIVFFDLILDIKFERASPLRRSADLTRLRFRPRKFLIFF